MTEQPVQISEDAQKALFLLQGFQQQLQSLMIQKETFQIQAIELEKALEELEKTKDTEEVFKAVGPILIKSTKKDLQDEMKEKKETVDIRIKTVEKQELEIKEKMKDAQGDLQKSLEERKEEKGEAS